MLSSPGSGEHDIMVRHFRWTLCAVALLVAAPAFAEGPDQDARAAPSRSPQARPKFWQDPALRQEIGITDQQSAAIEQIFSSSIQSLREAHRELDALEAVLSRTIKENTADLITVSQQVDKVEAARSAYNKARTVMIYRMNLVLNPEQREKVKALNERYEERRRKDDDERRRQGTSDRR
jgi:Spy/CpxP family protein refolding chaperone